MTTFDSVLNLIEMVCGQVCPLFILFMAVSMTAETLARRARRV